MCSTGGFKLQASGSSPASAPVISPAARAAGSLSSSSLLQLLLSVPVPLGGGMQCSAAQCGTIWEAEGKAGAVWARSPAVWGVPAWACGAVGALTRACSTAGRVVPMVPEACGPTGVARVLCSP